MLTGLVLKLIDLVERFFFAFSWFLLFVFICLSHSTSISTFDHLSSSNQFQFMSNSSYRNFLLRQYFIDLLNISDASLVRSMIYDHQQTNRTIQIHNRKRKHVDMDLISSTPVFTLQSSNCLMMDNRVQSTFLWSQSIESLTSIELIYHLDSLEQKSSRLPLRLKFQHFQTFVDLLTIDTFLEFDSNRDFYAVNIFPLILQANQTQLIIQSSLIDETCQTSHSYLIISSKIDPTPSFDLRQLNENPTDSSTSMCKLKTIQIKFEDLGLAYLIIRPREYTFTYCDGTCLLPQQSSIHALFQSIVNRKNPEIPQPKCVPTQFADDNFLVRQMDGTMEIYPIKDVIVKQCACL